MKNRCKHQNGYLEEYATIANNKRVTNGKLDEIGMNTIGNISGYLYYCFDCKKTWRFKSGVDRIPKWLKKIMDQL